MADNANDSLTIISLENLDTYTGFVEQKSPVMTYEEYLALPEATKMDGKTRYITNSSTVPAQINSLIFSMTATLTAGSTSVTFSDNRIQATSKILLCNPVSGQLNPTAVTEGTNSITLTFEEQASDATICILVFNV